MASTDKEKQISSKSRPVKGDARHIVPENGHWVVKEEGTSDVKTIFPTQSDAISAALAMAKNNSEIIVHSRNGRVKNTISNSPTDRRMLDVWKSIHEAQLSKRKK